MISELRIFYQGLVFTVNGVEMRRWMVGPEHSDDDAVEAAELRHEVARDGALGIIPRGSCLSTSDKANQGTIQFRRSI